MAWILCCVVELDLEQDWEKIKPMAGILRNAWLLPMHAAYLQHSVY